MPRVAQFAPDLLITDVHLTGLSGIELAKHARAFAPQIAVIFATRAGPAPSLGAGKPSALPTKPFDTLSLAKAIRQAYG